MEHGEVIEMGTHNELLKKNGLYANLVKTQTLNESGSLFQKSNMLLHEVCCKGQKEGSHNFKHVT